MGAGSLDVKYLQLASLKAKRGHKKCFGLIKIKDVAYIIK
jgi:hypothetical protein